MGKFNFLVFDGLSFDDYETFETDLDNLIKDVEKALGKTGGYTTKTSSWMNRFPVFEDGEKAFIIVPSTIPSYNNVVKATIGKYAVLLNHGEKGYLSFGDSDVKYFTENLVKQFDKHEREKKEQETKDAYAKVMLRDTFRAPLLFCQDDTVDIIRFLILNNLEELYKMLVLAGVFDNEETIGNIFQLIKCNPELSNIKIAKESFIRDIMLFFTPEVQFAHLELDPEEWINIYNSLCMDGNWMKEAFLGISEKECRDLYKAFIEKTLS